MMMVPFIRCLASILTILVVFPNLFVSSDNNNSSPLLRSRKRILPASVAAAGDKRRPSATFPVADGHDFIDDRLKMKLQCGPKSMVLQLRFLEPFRGVVSIGRPAYHRLSASESEQCSLRGDGRKNYSLQIFHDWCFTRFDKPKGRFSNLAFIRYHPTLETGGDHSKTLICQFGLADLNVN